MFKRALLVGLVLVAGCEKKKPSGPPDCELVSKDPGNAVAELSKRYPKDPVKVASTIENCVAPGGDTCDRVAKMVKAIPSMTPGTSAPRSADEYAKTCFASPPEVRKCFLASYALAHDAECKKVMLDMANAAITSVPLTTNEAIKRPDCDGGRVAVLVTNEGAWIATGADPKTGRCFRGRKGGAMDGAGIEGELAQFKTKDCKPVVIVAAEDDVKYQDIIHVMDIAVKVGLVDVDLATVDELPVSFEGAEPATGAEHCPATTIAGDGSTGSTVAGHQTVVPPAAAANPSAPTDLAKAHVVVVTRDAISVSGTDVVTVATAAKGSGPIAELAKALPKAASPDEPVILQADQGTAALVISRVIATAKAAGYTNVLFAVKNK